MITLITAMNLLVSRMPQIKTPSFVASTISIICELVIHSQAKQLAAFCRFSSMNKDYQKLNFTTHAMAYFMVPASQVLMDCCFYITFVDFFKSNL
jgi:hypothetical protein